MVLYKAVLSRNTQVERKDVELEDMARQRKYKVGIFDPRMNVSFALIGLLFPYGGTFILVSFVPRRVHSRASKECLHH